MNKLLVIYSTEIVFQFFNAEPRRITQNAQRVFSLPAGRQAHPQHILKLKLTASSSVPNPWHTLPPHLMTSYLCLLNYDLSKLLTQGSMSAVNIRYYPLLSDING